MRILLVTWTDQLLETLNILSPELEYCAIVTDEVKTARNMLKSQGNPPTSIQLLKTGLGQRTLQEIL